MTAPAPRNWQMEILSAHSKADVQTLAAIATELATSLAIAQERIAVLREADEGRRKGQRQRTKDWRSRHVTSPNVTQRDAPSLSPTPPFTTPTSTTASSPAREALWHPADEARLAARLASDADRLALTALLSMPGVSKSMICLELNGCLDGMPAYPFVSPVQLGEALREFVANGKPFNMRYFKGYLKKSKQPPNETPRGGIAQRGFEASMEALKDVG